MKRDVHGRLEATAFLTPSFFKYDRQINAPHTMQSLKPLSLLAIPANLATPNYGNSPQRLGPALPTNEHDLIVSTNLIPSTTTGTPMSHNSTPGKMALISNGHQPNDLTSKFTPSKFDHQILPPAPTVQRKIDYFRHAEGSDAFLTEDTSLRGLSSVVSASSTRIDWPSKQQDERDRPTVHSSKLASDKHHAAVLISNPRSVDEIMYPTTSIEVVNDDEMLSRKNQTTSSHEIEHMTSLRSHIHRGNSLHQQRHIDTLTTPIRMLGRGNEHQHIDNNFILHSRRHPHKGERAASMQAARVRPAGNHQGQVNDSSVNDWLGDENRFLEERNGGSGGPTAWKEKTEVDRSYDSDNGSSETRCSDTVTVNEAVGDELSLGDDDFEYLPEEMKDEKLLRVASELETLFNQQLLQPIISQMNSVFGKR